MFFPVFYGSHLLLNEQLIRLTSQQFEFTIVKRSLKTQSPAHAFLIESCDQIIFHIPDMQVLVDDPVQHVCYMVILQFEELGLNYFPGTGSFFDYHCLPGKTDHITDCIVDLVNHLDLCRAVTPCRVQQIVQTDVISNEFSVSLCVFNGSFLLSLSRLKDRLIFYYI